MIGPLLLTIACAPNPMGAEYGSEVQIVAPTLDSFFIEPEYAQPGDGIGLLVLEQALVLSPSATDGQLRPANGIQVEIISGWSGAYVVSEGAVKLITDFEANCDPADLACVVWFDVQGEEYIEFAGEYESVGEFRPTYMSGVTDNRGLMPFYVFIDSVPLDENLDAYDISVYASIGVATASLSYTFD